MVLGTGSGKEGQVQGLETSFWRQLTASQIAATDSFVRASRVAPSAHAFQALMKIMPESNGEKHLLICWSKYSSNLAGVLPEQTTGIIAPAGGNHPSP